MRKDSIPGTKCTVRGQVYVQTGSFLHTKRNGWEVRVLELDTACPHCGNSFQVTASRRQIRTRQMVRRCPTCREVHFGPVPMSPKPPKPHLPTLLAAIMLRANLCGRYVPVSAVTVAATHAERKLFGGIGRRSARIRASFERRSYQTKFGTIGIEYPRRRQLRVKLLPGAAPAATPAVPSQQVVAPTPPMDTYQAALGMLS
jgi:predicted Zn finger-like uncharacterized protein